MFAISLHLCKITEESRLWGALDFFKSSIIYSKQSQPKMIGEMCPRPCLFRTIFCFFVTSLVLTCNVARKNAVKEWSLIHFWPWKTGFEKVVDGVQYDTFCMARCRTCWPCTRTLDSRCCPVERRTKYIIHLRLEGLSIPHLVQSPESRPANCKILKQIILDVFGLNFSPR